MKSVIENMEKNSLVLRLERNQRDVGQLRKKLNSYVCEPKTYNLFEKLEFLKTGLERLSNANLETIKTLKSHKKSMEDYIDHIKQRFIEFKELQKDVDDYMEGAKGY